MDVRKAQREAWNTKSEVDEVAAAGACGDKYGKLPPLPTPEQRAKGRILDLGCGYGRTLVPIASRTAAGDCIGGDISDVMLEKAAENLREDVDGAGAVHLAQASVDDLPFADETFDTVYSSAVLLHLPKEMAADTIEECLRVLRPDGMAYFPSTFLNIFHVWNPATTVWSWSQPASSTYVRRYSESEVREMFDHFSSVTIEYANHRALPGRKSDLQHLGVRPGIIDRFNERLQQRLETAEVKMFDILFGVHLNVTARK